MALNDNSLSLGDLRTCVNGSCESADAVHPSTRRQRENKRKIFALLGDHCCWHDDGGSCSWGPHGTPCDDPRALDIDHIQGGGEKDRSGEWGRGNAYYTNILRHLGTLLPGTKSDKVQLLCKNHNWIKRFINGEALGRRQHAQP